MGWIYIAWREEKKNLLEMNFWEYTIKYLVKNNHLGNFLASPKIFFIVERKKAATLIIIIVGSKKEISWMKMRESRARNMGEEKENRKISTEKI